MVMYDMCFISANYFLYPPSTAAALYAMQVYIGWILRWKKSNMDMQCIHLMIIAKNVHTHFDYSMAKYKTAKPEVHW